MPGRHGTRFASRILLGILALGLVSLLIWENRPAAPFEGGRPASSEQNYPLLALSEPPGPGAREQARIPQDPGFPFRLRNTPLDLDELSRRESAILLQNALIDTARPLALEIPGNLGAPPSTRSWLWQSDAPPDRDLLARLGVETVAYVPHSAWVVRAAPRQAERLRGHEATRALLPFAPYFKLQSGLLQRVLEGPAEGGPLALKLTLFADAREEALQGLEDMGCEPESESLSPFGPQVRVRIPDSGLARVASLDGVFLVERARPRRLASDLVRVRLGADSDPSNLSNTNLHDLSGEGVLLSLHDTGVDAGHPDLAGRVSSPDPSALEDRSGHGTHMAGIMIGSGESTPEIDIDFGSSTNANFHGMAPEAELFVLALSRLLGPWDSDEGLQQSSARYSYQHLERTNVLVSNNSWNYPDIAEYDSSAASFDAAVRDSLPRIEGAQPVLYVFSAGNEGSGNSEGRGGRAGSIASPATAKNVITVGALENHRYLTNDVLLPSTDSSREIASLSSRGNVGVGIEGRGGRFKPDVVAPGTFVISARSAGWREPDKLVDTRVVRLTNETVAPGSLSQYTLFVPLQAVSVRISVASNASSPETLPAMTIHARYGGMAEEEDRVGVSDVTLHTGVDSPLQLRPGVLSYAIGHSQDHPVTIDIHVLTEEEVGDESLLEGIQEINRELEPHYRIASGTSASAAAVSGLLGLFQEFFHQRGHDPSPALLKALLINGSRTVGSLYDFQIDPLINYQGWGVPSLANSLPESLGEGGDFWEGSATLRFLDQGAEGAMATGESSSWDLVLGEGEEDGAENRSHPLRISLVWTDPPGNPAGAIKLVNDLDLVVSNKVTGELFFGNRFLSGAEYTAGTTNDVPAWDNVNNVENVYLQPPLDKSYVVSVRARRVNVNALPGHADGVVQDYALVVSWGDNPEVPEAAPFRLEESGESAGPLLELPLVVGITNRVPRLADRVGSNAPLLEGEHGLAEQWRFYVFTNAPPPENNTLGYTNGPNVAFATFLPPNLALPRNQEADIDLYVSRNPALTNLEPAVLAEAVAGDPARGIGASRQRGGTESVIFENQALGEDQIYYIGVKSEDRQGGQYAFVGLSQEEPFDQTDPKTGNRLLQGVLLEDGIIPDGSPTVPGAALTLALGNPLDAFTVRKVVADLSLEHQDIGDLLGQLSHRGVSMVLNNHTTFNPDGVSGELRAQYDDLGRSGDRTTGPENLVRVRSDGPGSLVRFIGEPGDGVWLMNQIDNALTHEGRVVSFRLIATPNFLAEGEPLDGEVEALSFDYHVIDIPADASALQIDLYEFGLPLDLYLRRGDLPTLSVYDKRTLAPEGSDRISLRLTRDDVPPLSHGRYYLGIYNPNLETVAYKLLYRIERNLLIQAEQPFLPEETGVGIPDDALVRSRIRVPDNRVIADVKVGLRLDHPRASDLAMHLIGPTGSRALLAENRGGTEARGWGRGEGSGTSFGGLSDDPGDTSEYIKFASPPYASDGIIEILPVSGFEEADPGIYGIGDTFPANAQGQLWTVTSGEATVVGGAGSFVGVQHLRLEEGRLAISLELEPGRSRELFFSTRSEGLEGEELGSLYLSGEWARDILGSPGWVVPEPIRFTPREEVTVLEISGSSPGVPLHLDAIEIRDTPGVEYHFGEEDMDVFDGQRANGEWTLEILDRRAGPGPGDPPLLPILHSWQLLLSLAETNYPAVNLRNGQCVSDTVRKEETLYYIVDVPRSATIATNSLATEGSLTLMLHDEGLPRPGGSSLLETGFGGEGGGEVLLDLSGTRILDPEGQTLEALDPPRLEPGRRYYLGVRNTDPESENGFELCVRFDQDDTVIIDLENGVPRENVIPSPDVVPFQYYRYRAGANVASLEFLITPQDGDVDAVGRRGLPLPDLDLFDLESRNSDLSPESLLFTIRPPATIPAGDYFVGVFNADPGYRDVRYSIVANETSVPYDVIHLEDGIPTDYSVPPSPDGIGTYFYLDLARSGASSLHWDLGHLSDLAPLVVRWDDLPAPGSGDRSATGDPDRPGSGSIVLRTNQAMPDLSGPWFAAVDNPHAEDLAFTITATSYDGAGPVADLPNDEWVADTVVPSIPGEAFERDHYRFEVLPQATEVVFDLEPLVGDAGEDIELYLARGFLPGEEAHDALAAGSGPLVLRLGVGDGDIPLDPGVWYLAVVNPQEGALTYRIRARQTLDLSDWTLQDGIWRSGTAGAQGQRPDIYLFEVPPWAPSVTFELQPLPDAGGPSDLDLVVRWERYPEPDLDRFDAASRNPGPALESILLDGVSTPPLTPGRWYLRVVNRHDQEIAYRIRAVLGEDDGFRYILPEPVVEDGSLCLYWEAVPGREYVVQGRISLDDPLWETLDRVVADSDPEKYCVPLDTPYRYFAILYQVLPVEEETILPELAVEGDRLCLYWEASPGEEYLVRGRIRIDDTDWETIERVVAASDPERHCLPLDTPYRYFSILRQIRPPAEEEYIVPDLAVGEDEICLSWEAVPGREYLVRGRTRIDDPVWDGLARVVADSELERHCLPLDTPYRYFSILDQTRPPTEEERVVPDLAVSEDEICLSWEAVPGEEYLVQGRIRIDDPDWEDIVRVVADSDPERRCLPLDTPYRYFSILRQPAPPEENDYILPALWVSATEVCLSWPSRAGVRYLLEGRTSLSSEAWEPIARTTAAGPSVVHCLELPTGYRYFRASVAGPEEPDPGDLQLELAVGEDTLCLRWNAEIGGSYVVEGRRSLVEAVWIPIATVLAGSDRPERCLPLPVPWRYLRVRPVERLEEEFPRLAMELEGEQLCLSWQAAGGRIYRIEGRGALGEEAWETIEDLSWADAPEGSLHPARHCLPREGSYRFYRVRALPREDLPEVPALAARWQDGMLCLYWRAQEGESYAVMGRAALDEPWIRVAEEQADRADMERCLEGDTPLRYFRIERLDQSPASPPVRLSIVREDGRICLEWESVPGAVYRVERSGDPARGPWTLEEAVEAGSASTTYCLPMEEAAQFYRLSIPGG